MKTKLYTYDYAHHFIGGQWQTPHSGEYIDVENPATREIIGRVPAGDAEDVDRAVKAAYAAYPGWRRTALGSRKRYIEAVLAFLREREALLVDMEVAELGAPREWARRAHVLGPMGRIEAYLAAVDGVPTEDVLTTARIVKEPVGVVGCITPWNYPLGQVVQKVIPALLTGNTVVLKPSQITPLSAVVLAQAFEASGIPGGVFNLVTGRGGDVGNPLASHPKVRMVSFTGSTEGGKQVGKLALDGIRKIALELGGKSPNVVLKGADYSKAVKAALGSCFNNTGQTCAALTRMLVPREDLAEIEALILEGANAFKIGDPTALDTVVGPLASAKQYEKVRGYIQKGVEEGARLILGEVPEETPGAYGLDGYFVSPCVFSDVRNDMTIARDEIFGPVLSIIPYDSEEEAIAMANDTDYGLYGAVFGPRADALRVAGDIEAGMVVVNGGVRDERAPFGGYKQSGIGREGGPYGIEEFFEIKSILA